jgi:hypothetical protein
MHAVTDRLGLVRRMVGLLTETGPDAAKPRLLSWLMRTIEDIYDQR